MLGKILSIGVFGIDGYMVEVEFDVRGGQGPKMSVFGNACLRSFRPTSVILVSVR